MILEFNVRIGLFGGLNLTKFAVIIYSPKCIVRDNTILVIKSYPLCPDLLKSKNSALCSEQIRSGLISARNWTHLGFVQPR